MSAKCSLCKGKRTIQCPTCGGKGRVYPLPLTGLGATDCSKCKGSQQIKCPACNGKGEVK